MLQAIVAETFFLFFSLHTWSGKKKYITPFAPADHRPHSADAAAAHFDAGCFPFAVDTVGTLHDAPLFKKNRSNFLTFPILLPPFSSSFPPTLSSSPSSFLHIGAERHGKSSKRARVAAPATTLEQAVFGGAAKVLGADLYSAASAAADSDGDDAAAAAGPAWVDDDDAGLSVDVVSKPRARKLRADEAEKALKGNVYASRLKTQFEKVKNE